MTGVKTDTGTGSVFNTVQDPPDVLEAAADTVLLTCRVLKKQHDRIVRCTKSSIYRTDNPHPSSGNPVTKVMPEMGDEIRDTKPPAPVKFSGEGCDRLFVYIRFG